MLLEDGLDVAHLDVAQGGCALGDGEVGRADRGVRVRGAECWVRPLLGNWVGRCSGRIGPLPARIKARSMALASSRMLPGQSCAISISIASGLMELSVMPTPQGVTIEHVPRECADVKPAVAQGGQEDLERVQPEEKIFTKMLVLDHLAQVSVGGAEDAHVNPERLVLAHAADLARFQEPQELDLHAAVELTDLVEEKRAAVGDLEEALAVGIGAGVRPLAMAEELALDQVFGKRRRS